MPELTPRERLGRELRRVRTLAGVSQTALAGAADSPLGARQATVSQIENGVRTPTREQVQVWLGHADSAARSRVTALLDRAHLQPRPWSEVYGGRTSLQDDAAAEVEQSLLVRTFQMLVPPGLVQTAEMARAIFTKLGVVDPDVEAVRRVQRQEVLADPSRQFRFLLLDRVLDCALAPRARAAQLAHLAAVAGFGNVELGVVSSGEAVGVHSFDLFTPADGSPTYAKTELIDEYHPATGVEAMAAYEEAWLQLWSAAATGDDAVELIRGA